MNMRMVYIATAAAGVLCGQAALAQDRKPPPSLFSAIVNKIAEAPKTAQATTSTQSPAPVTRQKTPAYESGSRAMENFGRESS